MWLATVDVTKKKGKEKKLKKRCFAFSTTMLLHLSRQI